jgi:hypothetical protein
MSVFDTIEVERNGRVWRMHWKNRHDPVTLMVLTAVGGGIGIAGTLKQGKQAEKIAKRRAEIDLAAAEQRDRAAVEEAKIKAERGQRARATARSTAAAANIRINEGVPLVIETQMLADLTKDIGFGLERGRGEAESLRESAALEIAAGKQAKKKSRFDALAQGLSLAGTLVGMGQNLPVKTSTVHPAGTFQARTGRSMEQFGRDFISIK